MGWGRRPAPRYGTVMAEVASQLPNRSERRVHRLHQPRDGWPRLLAPPLLSGTYEPLRIRRAIREPAGRSPIPESASGTVLLDLQPGRAKWFLGEHFKRGQP